MHFYLWFEYINFYIFNKKIDIRFQSIKFTYQSIEVDLSSLLTLN